MTAKSTTPTTQPTTYGPIQLPNRLGLTLWQFDAARRRGLVPDPDVPGGRWSQEVTDQLTGQVEDIVAVVGAEPPIGAARAASRLASRAGLEVDRDDVRVLAERGVLTACGEYEGWPLYDPRHLDQLDLAVVGAVVDERSTWMATSLSRDEVLARLGWRWREFEAVAEQRDLRPGRLGRYAAADVDALAGDVELGARVAADREIGPDQAAARLGIRRLDWDYAVAAGWISATQVLTVQRGRYRQADVPLYRTGDVDLLLTLPGVDWQQVREVRKGQPSPLREFAHQAPTRAQVVRRWVRDLGARHGVEVWAWYCGGADRWEIDWDQRDGHPTRDEAAAAVAADPTIAQYADDLVLSTQAGAAIRWARAMLAPGAAVILDTETTDLYGACIEIAVIDAATGDTLLDTLVHPGPGQTIADGAYAVHRISLDDLDGAPTWDQVLPELLRVTAGRQVLAYNSDFDQTVVVGDSRRYDLDPGHLAAADSWGCLMNRRSDWLRSPRWLPLGGGHRALGDCRAARDVLLELVTPAR